jgi:hypothetical protein
LVPPSRDQPSSDKVEAASLIGDARGGGKANGWVAEYLANSARSVDRINRVCADAWLGFGLWINNDQDAANEYWTHARAELDKGQWDALEVKALRLAELMREFPE